MSGREYVAANTAASEGLSVFEQVAADYADGDSTAIERVGQIVEMAKSDPAALSTLSNLYQYLPDATKQSLLDQAGVDHPIQQAAGAEPTALPAEPDAGSQKRIYRVPSDVRYAPATYGGGDWSKRIAKKFPPSTSGDGTNTRTFNDEMRAAFAILSDPNRPGARTLDELRSMNYGEVLALLTEPEAMRVMQASSDFAEGMNPIGEMQLQGEYPGVAQLRAMRAAIDRFKDGDKTPLDIRSLAKWWRASHPQMNRNLELEYSDKALHPRMLAGLVAENFQQPKGFAAELEPLIDIAIREYAPLPPSTETGGRYKNNATEADYARMQLAPPKKSSATLRTLMQLREGLPVTSRGKKVGMLAPLPHPMFSDIPLNRGMDAPANIGSDISAEPPPPPPMPADNDLGALLPQNGRLPPQILQSLLA